MGTPPIMWTRPRRSGRLKVDLLQPIRQRPKTPTAIQTDPSISSSKHISTVKRRPPANHQSQISAKPIKTMEVCPTGCAKYPQVGYQTTYSKVQLIITVCLISQLNNIYILLHRSKYIPMKTEVSSVTKALRLLMYEKQHRQTREQQPMRHLIFVLCQIYLAI